MMMRMIVPIPMYMCSSPDGVPQAIYPAAVRGKRGPQCSATRPPEGSSGRPSSSHAVSPPAIDHAS